MAKNTAISDEQARLLSLLRKGRMAGFALRGLFATQTIRSATRRGWIKYDLATSYYHLTEEGEDALINKGGG
jgi:hypothetical protein